MLKRIAVIVLLVLSLTLQVGVTPATAGNFKRYVDSVDGYEFFYPNGWIPVKVSNGPDLVMRDLIEVSENVSVVLNPVPKDKTLTGLGSPTDVGYKLMNNVIAPANSGIEAELVNAESHDDATHTYYTFEFTVHFPDQDRHNLTNVAISRGKLFTFNASTTEERWEKVEPLLRTVANSFSVY